MPSLPRCIWFGNKVLSRFLLVGQSAFLVYGSQGTLEKCTRTRSRSDSGGRTTAYPYAKTFD